MGKDTILWVGGILFLVTSCGRILPRNPRRTAIEPPPKPVLCDSQRTSFVVAMWGAPWCTFCKIYFPKIDKELGQEFSETCSRITSELWVTTGERKWKPPTSEEVSGYRSELGIRATAKADPYYAKFKMDIQDTDALPAVVIYRNDGSKAKVFYPGQFQASDVVTKVKELLGGP